MTDNETLKQAFEEFCKQQQLFQWTKDPETLEDALAALEKAQRKISELQRQIYELQSRPAYVPPTYPYYPYPFGPPVYCKTNSYPDCDSGK